jgi:hypothetical protein
MLGRKINGMNSINSRIACYRRPDPSTGQIHRQKPRAGHERKSIGEIEYTLDPAFFFHAEKYRGFNEDVRLAIMEASSLDQARALLDQHPLNGAQVERWRDVSARVLRCAIWFALTQHTGRALGMSPDRFDQLDVLAANREVQERLQSPTRLVIAGSRELAARTAAYALIDWFVENRELGGHGVSGTVDEVVSGNANGADAIGEEWAMGRYIPVAHFPARWELGNGAGYARNELMEKAGTHLLAFHLHQSNGTANMIDCFVLAKKPHWKFTENDVNRMREILAERTAAQTLAEASNLTPKI